MRFIPAGAATLAIFLTASAVAQAPPTEPRFTAAEFRAHVAFLADDRLEGRRPGARGYDLAALYVATRFEAMGLVPASSGGWYQQVPLPGGGSVNAAGHRRSKQNARRGRREGSSMPTSPNVLAILPGSDPRLADEYVLLMAHLDHLGVDPSLDGDQIHNGALDNAAGVATMLEVARALATSSKRPRRPILFAAVTSEEEGLLGSQYLAHNPVMGGKVVAVVNLDMPMLLYDFIDIIAFGAEHSTLGEAVQRAAAHMKLSVSGDPIPEERLFTRSDHYSFVREGVPSVFLMTGFGGLGRERFTGFLRDHYHKPGDDIGRPIDWIAGTKFARLNYWIAREIADSDTAPLWYADSDVAAEFAPDQQKAQRPEK